RFAIGSSRAELLPLSLVALGTSRKENSMNKFMNQPMALLVTGIIASQSLAGCGSSTTNTSNLPPVDDSASSRQASTPPPVQRGMSSGQKVALLAGAAALYYMYNKNKQAHQNGNTTAPQYYLSKNGRVYYREQGGRVHWVTPPSAGIQVTQEEANQYQEFQGYGGRSTGRWLGVFGR